MKCTGISVVSSQYDCVVFVVYVAYSRLSLSRVYLYCGFHYWHMSF